MSTDALRLADALEEKDYPPRRAAAAELRRLHEENERLKAASTAQRPPLTDEAIWRQYQALWPFHPAEEPRLAKDIVKFARAIEAAHGIKEKNT